MASRNQGDGKRKRERAGLTGQCRDFTQWHRSGGALGRQVVYAYVGRPKIRMVWYRYVVLHCIFIQDVANPRAIRRRKLDLSGRESPAVIVSHPCMAKSRTWRSWRCGVWAERAGHTTWPTEEEDGSGFKGNCMTGKVKKDHHQGAGGGAAVEARHEGKANGRGWFGAGACGQGGKGRSEARWSVHRRFSRLGAEGGLGAWGPKVPQSRHELSSSKQKTTHQLATHLSFYLICFLPASINPDRAFASCPFLSGCNPLTFSGTD